MKDADQAWDPADDQHSHTVLPVLIPVPTPIIFTLDYQVDSLQDVRYGVAEADGNVEEDYLEDDEGGEAVDGHGGDGGV